jgi:actin-related protein 9
MFPAEKKGEWEPVKVRERKIIRQAVAKESNENKNEDNGMDDGTRARDKAGSRPGDADEEILYEEDSTTDEGAVYPLHAGRVVNWSCFFALLTHVFNTLSPPFHTPILVVSQPAWTAKDHERLAQFFFEKFKTPAFCLMDSALAVSYAYATPTATVVDIGHSKCDITAVSEFVASDLGRVVALAGCGGEGLTQRLFDLLRPKGFTKDMCEQLKKSAFCEILPPGTELPVEEGSEDRPIQPATAVSAAAVGPGYGSKGSISAQGGMTGAVAAQTITGDDDDRDGKEGEENEGVLDVASIVVSGKTSEWVAKKEREKAEKAAAKKAASDAAAPKAARVPNSKRAKAIFHYNEKRPLEDLDPTTKSSNARPEGESGKRQKTPEPGQKKTWEGEAGVTAPRKEERRRNAEPVALIRKDIEVGIERFQAVDGGILDQLVDSIHRCILSVPEVAKRSELWDSIIIVGNGSKIKGAAHKTTFILQTILLLFHAQIHKLIYLGRNRPERCDNLHPQRKIRHLPFQRHHLYI